MKRPLAYCTWRRLCKLWYGITYDENNNSCGNTHVTSKYSYRCPNFGRAFVASVHSRVCLAIGLPFGAAYMQHRSHMHRTRMIGPRARKLDTEPPIARCRRRRHLDRRWWGSDVGCGGSYIRMGEGVRGGDEPLPSLACAVSFLFSVLVRFYNIFAYTFRFILQSCRADLNQERRFTSRLLEERAQEE